jgi:hypothetical protein
MATTCKIYGNALKAAWNKEIDLNDGNMKVILCTSSYTPNVATHDYYDDITNELTTAGGYTAGGAAVANPTVSYTAANSWTAWAANTAYTVGTLRRPSTGNGLLYRCAVAGTSHASTEPTWPTTVGETVTDNGITWVCAGVGVFKFDCDDTAFSSATFTCRHAILLYSTGTDSTSPLICVQTFDADQNPSSGTFTVQWPSEGIILQTHVA